MTKIPRDRVVRVYFDLDTDDGSHVSYIENDWAMHYKYSVLSSIPPLIRAIRKSRKNKFEAEWESNDENDDEPVEVKVSATDAISWLNWLRTGASVTDALDSLLQGAPLDALIETLLEADFDRRKRERERQSYGEERGAADDILTLRQTGRSWRRETITLAVSHGIPDVQADVLYPLRIFAVHRPVGSTSGSSLVITHIPTGTRVCNPIRDRSVERSAKTVRAFAVALEDTALNHNLSWLTRRGELGSRPDWTREQMNMFAKVAVEAARSIGLPGKIAGNAYRRCMRRNLMPRDPGDTVDYGMEHEA